jgi:dUTP pyrophosphatase
MLLNGFNFYYELVGGSPPTLAHDTDTGYDVELIEKIKVVKTGSFGEVSLYDSGIIVSPPLGYYIDLVARSSIAKTGHMLANGFGVIDNTYRGHLLAAVLKYDVDAPDLKLPGKYVQLIFRPVIHFIPVEVDTIDETVRGVGGFGSTDDERNKLGMLRKKNEEK